LICIDCKKKDNDGDPIRDCRGIVKFYKFKHNHINHIFFKIERWRTIKADEMINHWKGYQKKTKYHKSTMKRVPDKERAEDCKDKCQSHYKNDYKKSNGKIIKKLKYYDPTVKYQIYLTKTINLK
jgi:hypothetical protein